MTREARSERDRVLWLRAYLRATDLSGDGPEARLVMCRQAMELAPRPEDRRLVLASIARVPSVEALRWLLGMLEDADLRPHAAGSILNLAERLADDHPAEAVAAVKRGLEAAGDNPGYRTRAEHLIRRVGKG
jgi:enoyl-CoA hydratase/carnithine racemase